MPFFRELNLIFLLSDQYGCQFLGSRSLSYSLRKYKTCNFLCFLRYLILYCAFEGFIDKIAFSRVFFCRINCEYCMNMAIHYFEISGGNLVSLCQRNKDTNDFLCTIDFCLLVAETIILKFVEGSPEIYN